MNRQSDYLLGQRVGDDLATWLIRIRGRSFLGDPNDFAQFMVSLIPIMFLSWGKGATLRNFFLVYVPSGVLLFGMFETHSRGSMVALMIMCIVALRRRIGLVRSVVIGMALFAGLSAVGYSGGRDVSAGDDRVAAWAGGLMLIRSHPIFGVGFNRFSDFYEITAHNTFVVCAAELGLVGAFFWVLLMYVTVRNSLETEKDPNQNDIDENKKLDAFHAKQPFLQGIPNFTEVAMTPATVAGSAPISSQSHRYPGSPFVLPPDLVVDSANHVGANYLGVTNGEEDKEAQDAEIRRMAGLMTISFAAFLTAGWFLSRSYTMCLYVNAGFAAAVYRMAQDRGIAPPQLTFGEAAKMSAKIIFLLLAIVWIIVHTDHYLPH